MGRRERDMVTIRLEVHDSGPGIRPSDLVDGRLFQPFVQTNVGKLTGKGSGLGLAIVRQIVSLSGGRLGVRSRKGQGAMFWVEMSYPLATTQEVQASRSTLAPFAPMSTFSPPLTIASPNPTRSPRPTLQTIPSSESRPARDLPSDSPTKPHALVTHATESSPAKDNNEVNIPDLPHVDLSVTSPMNPRQGLPPTMAMVLPPLPRYQSHEGRDDVTESEHGSRPQDSPVNVVSPPGLTPTLPGTDNGEDRASEEPILERPIRPSPIVTPGPQGAGKAQSAPAASMPPMPAQKAPANGSGVEEHPLVVLVVDDDPMTRTLMTRYAFLLPPAMISFFARQADTHGAFRMLTKLGCVVDTADDGQQFLDIILAEDARTYDLVSLDNYMPVMTGEDAVRELRSKGRTDLVVGCTGNALTEDQLNYMEAGADKVLTKPIMMKCVVFRSSAG